MVSSKGSSGFRGPLYYAHFFSGLCGFMGTCSEPEVGATRTKGFGAPQAISRYRYDLVHLG